MIRASFPLASDDPIGWGGESLVWALDDERVLKVSFDRSEAFLGRLAGLYELLDLTAPFRVPVIHEFGSLADLDPSLGSGAWAIQRRIGGVMMMEGLAAQRSRPEARRGLLRHLVEVAFSFGCVAAGDGAVDWGDAAEMVDPVTAPSWDGYLVAKGEAQLRRLDTVEASVSEAHARWCAAVEGLEPEHRVLCHGDLYPDNILVAPGAAAPADLGGVGVLDLSVQAVWGDPLLDPASAIAFLALLPRRNSDDLHVCIEHVRRTRPAVAGDLVARLRLYALFYAFYYLFATNEPALHRWATSTVRRAERVLDPDTSPHELWTG